MSENHIFQKNLENSKAAKCGRRKHKLMAKTYIHEVDKIRKDVLKQNLTYGTIKTLNMHIIFNNFFI